MSKETDEMLKRAQYSIRLRDYESAVKNITGTIRSDPSYKNNPKLFLMLGDIFYNQKNYKKSYEYYSFVLRIDPNNIDGLFNMGRVLKALGHVDKALSAYKKASEIDNKRSDILVAIGELYRENNDIDHSKEFYYKALKANPKNSDIYSNLGLLYLDLGEMDLAEDILNKGLKFDANDPLIHYNLGVIQDSRNDLAGAYEEYKKATHYRPNHKEALNNLGQICEKLGDYQGARRSFLKAISVDDKYIKAYNNLAAIYELESRDDDALTEYDKVKRIDPENTQAIERLSELNFKKGDYAGALSNFRKLIEKKVDDKELLLKASESVGKAGSKDELKKVLSYMIETHSKDVEVLQRAAQLYLQYDLVSESELVYNRLTELSGDKPENELLKSKILFKSGNFQQALKVSNSVADEFKDEEAMLLEITLLIKLKQFDKALTVISRIKRNKFNNRIIDQLLLKIYNGLGLIEEANNLINSMQSDLIDVPENLSYLNEDEENIKVIFSNISELYKIKRAEEEESAKIEKKRVEETALKKVIEDRIGRIKQFDQSPVIKIGDKKFERFVEEDDEEVDLEKLEKEVIIAKERMLAGEDLPESSLLNLIEDDKDDKRKSETESAVNDFISTLMNSDKIKEMIDEKKNDYNDKQSEDEIKADEVEVTDDDSDESQLQVTEENENESNMSDEEDKKGENLIGAPIPEEEDTLNTDESELSTEQSDQENSELSDSEAIDSNDVLNVQGGEIKVTEEDEDINYDNDGENDEEIVDSILDDMENIDAELDTSRIDEYDPDLSKLELDDLNTDEVNPENYSGLDESSGLDGMKLDDSDFDQSFLDGLDGLDSLNSNEPFDFDDDSLLERVIDDLNSLSDDSILGDDLFNFDNFDVSDDRMSYDDMNFEGNETIPDDEITGDKFGQIKVEEEDEDIDWGNEFDPAEYGFGSEKNDDHEISFDSDFENGFNDQMDTMHDDSVFDNGFDKFNESDLQIPLDGSSFDDFSFADLEDEINMILQKGFDPGTIPVEELTTDYNDSFEIEEISFDEESDDFTIIDLENDTDLDDIAYFDDMSIDIDKILDEDNLMEEKMILQDLEDFLKITFEEPIQSMPDFKVKKRNNHKEIIHSSDSLFSFPEI